MSEPREWKKSWDMSRTYCVSCERTPKQKHLKACVFSKVARLEAQVKMLERENRALRANVSKSVLRRLAIQLEADDE